MSQMSLVLISAFTLVGALVGVSVAYLKLKRAKVELERTKLELERTKGELGGAREALEVEEIKRLMENIGCHGRLICVEILSLWSCRTPEQASASLERLEAALKGLPEKTAPPPANWLQEALRAVCDGTSPMHLDPLTSQPVYEKTINCYKALLRWLDEHELQRAASDCIKWLTNSRLRKEVARTLLPAVLFKMPGNGDLISTYQHLLAEGEHAGTIQERDVIAGALLGLASLPPAVGSGVYLALLEAGVQAVFKQWQSFGTAWCQAAHEGLGGLERLREKRAKELSELSGKLAGHIKAQGNNILREDRRAEYDALTGVILHIHNVLGNHRQHRPRNRHVVTDEPVRAVIDFTGGQRVTGGLVNFSSGDDNWRAGAWIVSEQVPSWPTESADSPQQAILKLEVPNLGEIMVKNADLFEKPRREEGMYGFRLRLAPDPTERAQLAKLAEMYPLRR